MDKQYDNYSSDTIQRNVSNPASKFSSICFDWSETVVQAVILVVLLMTFLFRMFTVDGKSMMNTLFNGDKVAVIRWKYVPKNGDVVVIKHGEEYNKPLIKRVIATEGQTLKINFDTGKVFVNGQKLNETYIKERMWLEGDAEIPEVIPEGHCFVMGDNRNNSSDSRNKVIGLIPNENIVGKAKFVIYPFNRIKVIE